MKDSKIEHEEFSRVEKLAIIRIMEKIAKANSRIDSEEMDFMLDVVQNLHMTSNDVYEAKELNLEEVGTIISEMSSDKKSILSRTLVDLAMADGHLDPAQVKVMLDTLLSFHPKIIKSSKPPSGH